MDDVRNGGEWHTTTIPFLKSSLAQNVDNRIVLNFDTVNRTMRKWSEVRVSVDAAAANAENNIWLLNSNLVIQDSLCELMIWDRVCSSRQLIQIINNNKKLNNIMIIIIIINQHQHNINNHNHNTKQTHLVKQNMITWWSTSLSS